MEEAEADAEAGAEEVKVEVEAKAEGEGDMDHRPPRCVDVDRDPLCASGGGSTPRCCQRLSCSQFGGRSTPWRRQRRRLGRRWRQRRRRTWTTILQDAQMWARSVAHEGGVNPKVPLMPSLLAIGGEVIAMEEAEAEAEA